MASNSAVLDPLYVDAISAVEDLIGKRVPFWQLEDYIEGLDGLDDEQRSALWLLALASEDTPDTRMLRRVVAIGSVVEA